MKFKVDENLPVDAADALRAAGHDPLTIHECWNCKSSHTLTTGGVI